VLQTDHFVRFERVDAVRETSRGLVADVHGERFRVDVVTESVVRLAMTRGGRFDETPTYAVCVDPMATEVAFDVVRDDERVRLVTAGLVVSVWLDPFRVDVHRPDGTPVVETAADAEGRSWAYATLNDSWTLRRRCRQEDAVFGLGEKGGRHNRKGRDFTLWNTDVLNASQTREFTADKEPGDPRGDRTSVEFDPYYVSVPFLYHQSHPAGSMAGSFVDNGYRGSYEFSPAEEYRITFSGGQWTEYVFAGPEMGAILRDYTGLTGRLSPPPIWALGYHQCRWFHYTQDAVEAIGRRHRDEGIPCDALWLDIDYMDGYRVFTWDAERFPDPPGMLERLSELGFRVITIIDPGVKREPGYWVFDQGLERDVFCRTEGGDTYRPGVARRHSLPRLRHRGGPRLVG
jgi:alpha-glucosidase